MQYVQQNGGDPKAACYKKGHELGYSDEQINAMVSEQAKKISAMIQNNTDPNTIIQNALAARNPRFAQMQQMAQKGNSLKQMLSYNSAK